MGARWSLPRIQNVSVMERIESASFKLRTDHTKIEGNHSTMRQVSTAARSPNMRRAMSNISVAATTSAHALRKSMSSTWRPNRKNTAVSRYT